MLNDARLPNEFTVGAFVAGILVAPLVIVAGLIGGIIDGIIALIEQIRAHFRQSEGSKWDGLLIDIQRNTDEI